MCHQYPLVFFLILLIVFTFSFCFFPLYLKCCFKSLHLVSEDIDECASSNVCGRNQTCRSYDGAHECFCTSPGQFLVNKKCEGPYTFFHFLVRFSL